MLALKMINYSQSPVKEWQNPLVMMGGDVAMERLKIHLTQKWDSLYYTGQCWGLCPARKNLSSKRFVFTLLTWIYGEINWNDLDRDEGYKELIEVHIFRYFEVQWKFNYSAMNKDGRGRWIGYMKMGLANMHLVHMSLEMEETIKEWNIIKKLKGLYFGRLGKTMLKFKSRRRYLFIEKQQLIEELRGKSRLAIDVK